MEKMGISNCNESITVKAFCKGLSHIKLEEDRMEDRIERGKIDHKGLSKTNIWPRLKFPQ